MLIRTGICMSNLIFAGKVLRGANEKCATNLSCCCLSRFPSPCGHPWMGLAPSKRFPNPYMEVPRVLMYLIGSLLFSR